MEIMQVLDLLDIQERFSKSYLLVGVFSNMKAIKKKTDEKSVWTIKNSTTLLRGHQSHPVTSYHKNTRKSSAENILLRWENTTRS